jgi:putative peptidoglycan lipid II flippase
MGRFDDVRSTIQNALRSILFLSIPSSVGLMILSLPVVQVLYEHGVFTFDNSQSMVVPLVCFAVGLPGLAAVEILTRSFYALRDSKTPVMVSVWQFILKIALAILLLNPAVWLVQIGFSSIVHTTLSQQQLEGAWGMGALALSTSVAGLLEAMIMLWLLHQRIGQLQLRSLLQFVVRVMLATLAMAVGLIIARWLLDMVLAINETGNQSLHLIEIFIAFSKLLLEIFCGLFIYLRIARLLSIETLGPVRRLLNRFKLSWI